MQTLKCEGKHEEVTANATITINEINWFNDEVLNYTKGGTKTFFLEFVFYIVCNDLKFCLSNDIFL